MHTVALNNCFGDVSMRSALSLFCLAGLEALLFAAFCPKTSLSEDWPGPGYGFQQGQHYVYDVKVSGEIGDQKISRCDL